MLNSSGMAACSSTPTLTQLGGGVCSLVCWYAASPSLQKLFSNFLLQGFHLLMLWLPYTSTCGTSNHRLPQFQNLLTFHVYIVYPCFPICVPMLDHQQLMTLKLDGLTDMIGQNLYRATSDSNFWVCEQFLNRGSKMTMNIINLVLPWISLVLICSSSWCTDIIQCF